MAQQKLIFAGCIRIWSDNGEFVAEYKKYRVTYFFYTPRNNSDC